jgi:hypothetical protein
MSSEIMLSLYLQEIPDFGDNFTYLRGCGVSVLE